VQSVTVIDTLPPLLQGPLFTPAQGVYNETTGLWTGLSLMPGQSVVLTLRGTVDAAAAGSFVNTVTVGPPGGVTDPVPGNNTATDRNSTTPLIMLTTSSDLATARPGQELIYSVYYRNAGGSAATNLIVATTIPVLTTYVAGSMRVGTAASTYTTATPVSDQVSGANIVFTVASIAADDGVPNAGNDEGRVYFKVTVN
jgi:uncharacterized repeat protein (TIGR01451 family)